MHSAAGVCVPARPWLFLGAVCKEWEALYASLAAQQLRSCDLVYIKKILTCETKETLFSTAFASPVTARLAFDCGLDIYTEDEDKD
jgi:hypothetical protein